tara:strand:+ start:54 stop:647 length:594 start_codon:yes stop_codon:yes gene_type:complete
MSNEIENEIQESLVKDKIKNFLIRNKLKIITASIICIILLLSFPIYEEFKIKKNAKILQKYSNALLYLDANKKEEGIKMLNDLIKSSSNNKIKIFATNKLLTLYINEKNINEALSVINQVLSDKKVDKDEKELLNIKKVLLKFDGIDENEILKLLKPNKQNNSFKKLSYLILLDFYTMKNQKIKMKEINSILRNLNE